MFLCKRVSLPGFAKKGTASCNGRSSCKVKFAKQAASTALGRAVKSQGSRVQVSEPLKGSWLAITAFLHHAAEA